MISTTKLCCFNIEIGDKIAAYDMDPKGVWPRRTVGKLHDRFGYVIFLDNGISILKYHARQCRKIIEEEVGGKCREVTIVKK